MNRLTAALGAATIALTALADTPRRPNIVLFMVDDMGWQDTSVPFGRDTTDLNRRFHTPAMEHLAARGMKFTSAYACAISSPSRCSLLTGANQARHRVTNWTLRRDESVDYPDSTVILPDWNVNGIQPCDSISHSFPATSFVELLRRSGYRTIHCGKAHFGAMDTPGADPLNFGFDVNIAGHAAGGLASYLGEQRFGHDAEGRPVSPFAIPGLERYWDTDTFATEALTVEALRALREHQAAADGKPFFLYMSHYAVHIPIQADRRFIDRYKAMCLSDTEAAYATLVEGMDKSLGDIMDYLDDNGLADNTVVIFMSDNGGLAASNRTPPLGVQNAPLRSGKGSVYEGGVREPMIVSWPGVTPPASECGSYLIIEDFFPTILDIAGVSGYTTPQTVDGVSFRPLLDASADPSARRALIWNTPNKWIDSPANRDMGIGPTCAIRKGPYKLIYRYDDGSRELYDLDADIAESHDLAPSRPDLVTALSAELGDALRRMDAQRPAFRATGAPCPWPDENL